MSFKMTCPKCLSHSYTIYQDKHFNSYKDQAFGLVFSCRCGKQLFGENVVREHDRQKLEWDARHDGRGGKRVRPAADTQIERVRIEDKPVNSPMTEKPAAASALGAESSEMCAWAGCDNARRNNSKYCSRACSNKNARHRHKARKRTPARQAA
jgi:hypothetical protein